VLDLNVVHFSVGELGASGIRGMQRRLRVGFAQQRALCGQNFMQSIVFNDTRKSQTCEKVSCTVTSSLCGPDLLILTSSFPRDVPSVGRPRQLLPIYEAKPLAEEPSLGCCSQSAMIVKVVTFAMRLR
jgi:hypothetical protein